MGVSKVNYGNDTLIDLTGDTVTPNNLKRGETAHNRDGNQITGAMDTLPTWYGTLAEYEQLTPEEEANYLFFEPYDEGGYGTAADKKDLTNIDITGATNTTGATIAKDTFFYLNGDLVRAKADIANNASFTLNTNYEIVTAGGLNKLNSDIASLRSSLSGVWVSGRISGVTVPVASFAFALLPEGYTHLNSYIADSYIVLESMNVFKFPDCNTQLWLSRSSNQEAISCSLSSNAAGFINGRIYAFIKKR